MSNLSVEQFGDALFETEDLDPLYVALVKTKMTPATLKRWLLAYWMFYHGGVCSTLAVQTTAEGFWKSAKGFLYPAAPRGTERRHFRGEAATRAVEALSCFDPLLLVNWISDTSDLKEIYSRAQTLPLFGPWISWKIADMIDRVMNIRVDFSEANLEMYRDPVKGAQMVADRWGLPDMSLDAVCSRLESRWHKIGYKAPPFYDRLVNIQETETVLCKIKAHWHGKYPVGKDSREIRHALTGWNTLAEDIAANLPNVS